MSQLTSTKIKFSQKIQKAMEKRKWGSSFLNIYSNESFSQRKCYVDIQFLNSLKQSACHYFRSSHLFLIKEKILGMFSRNKYMDLQSWDDNYFMLASALNLLLVIVSCFGLLCPISIYSCGNVDVKVTVRKGFVLQTLYVPCVRWLRNFREHWVSSSTLRWIANNV